MDLKQIERLMAVMGRTGMKRIALKQEGFEIELERECAPGGSVIYAPPPSPAMPAANVVFASEKAEQKALVPLSATKEETSRFVTSPMVGTFYAAPSPENPPYAKVGDEVDEDTVVCIVEAMKVMNEVKAGVKGKITEILLKNGDPVEFGTKILRIL